MWHQLPDLVARMRVAPPQHFAQAGPRVQAVELGRQHQVLNPASRLVALDAFLMLGSCLLPLSPPGRVRVVMNDCYADAQPASGRSERLAALEKLDLPVYVVTCRLLRGCGRRLPVSTSRSTLYFKANIT